MQSVFSAALDDSQLGTLTVLFPGSQLSSEDIKLEGTFVFYKWLLTGISIPEWKRLQKLDSKTSSAENSSVQDDEQVGRRKMMSKWGEDLKTVIQHSILWKSDS